jgi:GNAT superfamily N-acetyltransferase
MQPDELPLISQIDRSEVIRTGYVQRGKALTAMDVDWDSPTWDSEGEGEHSVAAQIRFCREHLDRGGRLIGAFDGTRLAGIGVITPDIGPGLAQLAYLHVSRAYRRRAVGSRLVHEMISEARESGARRMYVSAVPSGSAVGFYLQLGFEPVREPLPDLYALEPEDIHMMMDL